MKGTVSSQIQFMSRLDGISGFSTFQCQLTEVKDMKRTPALKPLCFDVLYTHVFTLKLSGRARAQSGCECFPRLADGAFICMRVGNSDIRKIEREEGVCGYVYT